MRSSLERLKQVPNLETQVVQFAHLSPWAKAALRRGDLGGLSNAYRGEHKLQRAGRPRFTVERHVSGELDRPPTGTPQRLDVIDPAHQDKYRELLHLDGFEPTHLTTHGNNLMFLRFDQPDDSRTARLRAALKAAGHEGKVVKVDVIPV